MKKLLAIILSLCMLFGIIPFGALSVSAAVGDYTMTEIESNNTMSLADRIYNDYTVSGVVSGSDMDYFKFTLSSTSSVSIITIADYKSCFLAGIFNSSEKAVAVSDFVEYSDSGYPTYLTSITLNAGTYYYVIFNKDASTLRNDYMFYFEYTTTSSHTHSYSNSCDTTCNSCGATRFTSHTYSNACDSSCNVCGSTRTVSGHVYDNLCDSTCNTCGYERTPEPHQFGGLCDEACVICGVIPIEAAHIFDNNCDSTCNRCGTTRTPSAHIYSNGCDKSCNVCGITRPIGSHEFSNSCDTTCNVCGGKRTIKHTYTNNCDTKCNVCSATRTITHAYRTTTTKATLSKNGSIVKKCTVCGHTASSTIKYAKTFTLSTTSYTYDGKVKTPTVTVKDSAGKTLKKNTDYTVSYAKGRKNVGTYKVTIKLKGNYSGTKTLNFKINPAKTAVSKLTASKNSIKVNVTKKSTQVTGYQIQYSTSKKFTGAKTITSYKTTSVTLKNLKVKKLYYIRVRTYKTVNGKKYYSAWSTSKSKATTHTHSYYKATCTKAKTCKICNATSGKALGHTKTIKCTRCKKVLFTKLTYTGTGIKKISNINIPKGDYILKLVATGTHEDVIDNCFVYLYNGGKTYTSAYAGVTVSVPFYGWSSSEEDPFEGPIKNGTIKVDAPSDIKWTITIMPY